MDFVLEPNSATPSTLTLGLAICGHAPRGSLEVRISNTEGIIEYHPSVPVRMFADGGLHEIAEPYCHTITYYLDQKTMNTPSPPSPFSNSTLYCLLRQTGQLRSKRLRLMPLTSCCSCIISLPTTTLDPLRETSKGTRTGHTRI
jgi:hypothetical protein